MRRGTTLVEISALLTIAGIVLGGGVAVLRSLHALAAADASAGTMAERACLLLRRDLAQGTKAVEDGTLRILRRDGRVIAWRHEDGGLRRDGSFVLAVTAFRPVVGPAGTSVEIVPTASPPRRIEALP